MLKIPQHKRSNQLPGHIQDQLQPFPVYQIKFIIAVGTFLMLDAFVLVPLLFPFMKAFLYVILPFLAGIHVWAIWLLCKKCRRYRTGYYIICWVFRSSWCNLLFPHGSKVFLYRWNTITDLLYCECVYYFLRRSIFLYFSNIKNMIQLKKRPKKTTPAWQYTLVRVSVPAGYIIAQYIMGLSSTLVHVVMTIVWYGFSIFLFGY